MYSSYIIARSASRIRCRITCFAVCAAMRPKSCGVTSSRLIWLSGMSDQSISSSSSEIRVCCRTPVSTSRASSSSSFRSRASSIRRSSTSAGSSIEKTRKSPWSSSSTVAWREAPAIFLYAARRASSSAATSVPCSIPLSRSISRTASMISWLMALPFVDQVAPDDRLVRDVQRVSVHSDLHGTLARLEHLAAHAPLGRPQRNTAPNGVAEMRRGADGPLDPRRGHVDRVLPQVVPEGVRHPLPELVVDALRVVDEHGEALTATQLDAHRL